MSAPLLTAALEVVDEAERAPGIPPEVRDGLTRWRMRLAEPLRLGIAGIVKAGKSTLLNALIGERIAPTDAGECTRVVTWYRYGQTPSATMVLRSGEARRLALTRVDGRLEFDLQGTGVHEVERIEVRWPSSSLRELVLIDTPGIESATAGTSERTDAFLIRPEARPDDADALLYLMRHMHTADLAFLEAFADTAAGGTRAVNAIAVLSRADEVGAGRLDAMLSARRIAERYRTDPALRPLALTVLPVAGLLAETARTLREREFAAIRAVAALERPVREGLLLSVDRFVRGGGLDVPAPQRRALVDRFGISGLRLASALVRGGVRTSQELSERMLEQSGLEEVRALITRSLQPRSAAFKVGALQAALDELVPASGRPAALADAVERLQSAAHALHDIELLARSRTGGLGLDEAETAEAERLLGIDGVGAAERLGLPAGAGAPALRSRAEQLLVQWRSRSESPLLTRQSARACGQIVRVVEGVLSEIPAADCAAARSPAHVEPAGGPP